MVLVSIEYVDFSCYATSSLAYVRADFFYINKCIIKQFIDFISQKKQIKIIIAMFLNFLMIFSKYETNKIIIIHPSKINKINIVDYVSCSYYLQGIKGYLMMIRVRTTAFPLPIFPFIYNIYLIKEKEIIVKRKTECRMSYMDSMEHDI